MTEHPFVPWPTGEALVLASISPRRAELMRSVGLPFEVVAPGDIEARQQMSSSVMRRDPTSYAEGLACGKAIAVSERLPDRLVLGADTIVVLDRAVLEKPRDRIEASAMLTLLAGRRHDVITAIALGFAGKSVWLGHERTSVTFLPMPPAAVERYVKTTEPMDKAGAYGIQGYGAMMVSRVEGCYFNVMGLPLALLGCALREYLTGRKEIA